MSLVHQAPMRDEFNSWVRDRGCDTDGAWSAWQACWKLFDAGSVHSAAPSGDVPSASPRSASRASKRSAQPLTPWFSGKVKPARPGVYQRNTWGNKHNPTYSLWNGRYWGFSSRTPEGAVRREASNLQNKPWRGLAQEPKQ
jgi:hypothetical protein